MGDPLKAGAAQYLTGPMGAYGLLPGTPLAVPLTLGPDAATLNMMAAAAAGAQPVVSAASHVLHQSAPKAGRNDPRMDVS